MRPDTPDKKTVLIIGSGVGGLSTAILLAQLGFSVTVIEKNSRPGGLMRSYIRNGVECSVGVHYLGALGEGQVLRRLFDFLGISSGIPVERMGINGVIDRYVFRDFAFDLPEGFDAYENNLKATFKGETKQITTIMNTLRANGEKIGSLNFLFSTQNDGSMLEGIRPLGDILAELGCSPELKAVLGVPCYWIGVPMESCPVFYHNMALATYLFSSWRLTRSGSDMVNAFTNRLKSLDGKIICGDGVERIIANNRMVEGVQLISGRILKSPLLIGAIHPKVLLDMLPQEEIKPSYRRIVSKLKNTEGIYSAHFGINAVPHGAPPHNIFNISTERSGRICDLKYYQMREAGHTGTNLLTILTSGEPHNWKKWEHTISGLRGPDYIAQKKRRAWKLLQEAKEILGPLQGVKLLDAYTPLTLRDWMNSPEGSAYGILRSSEQFLETSVLNRTVVKGLFLSGQSAMAPGILGTIIGALHTVKLMIGADRFFETFKALR